MRKTMALVAICTSLSLTAAHAAFLNDIVRQIGTPQAIIQQDAINRAATDIKNNPAPQATQQDLERIYKLLSTTADDNLYFLKASADVCAYPARLTCGAAPSAAVKPLIDVELERRKSVGSEKDTQRNFYVSAGSLCVSVMSLLVSFGGGRKRKKT